MPRLFPNMIELPGNLNIGMPTCSDGSEEVYITLIDRSSGVQAIQIKISPQDFARALMGRGNAECKFGYMPKALELLGKVAETKHELISQDLLRGKTSGELDIILQQWEIDGWVASRYDIRNRHNERPNNMIDVTFTRFVAPPEVDTEV